MSWIYGDEFVDSACENHYNSGTKISMGSTGGYWRSHQWDTGEWVHYFTKTAYAEHYSENSSCDWEHDSGITQQWVGARSDNSALGVRFSSTPTHQGAYPASAGGEDVPYGDTVWTVASAAISTAFPGAAPAMTAAGLLGALKNDAAEQQSATWDSYQHWPTMGSIPAWLTTFASFLRGTTINQIWLLRVGSRMISGSLRSRTGWMSIIHGPMILQVVTQKLTLRPRQSGAGDQRLAIALTFRMDVRWKWNTFDRIGERAQI